MLNLTPETQSQRKQLAIHEINARVRTFDLFRNSNNIIPCLFVADNDASLRPICVTNKSSHKFGYVESMGEYHGSIARAGNRSRIICHVDCEDKWLEVALYLGQAIIVQEEAI